jgi:hypothetical protein
MFLRLIVVFAIFLQSCATKSESIKIKDESAPKATAEKAETETALADMPQFDSAGLKYTACFETKLNNYQKAKVTPLEMAIASEQSCVGFLTDYVEALSGYLLKHFDQKTANNSIEKVTSMMAAFKNQTRDRAVKTLVDKKLIKKN